MRRHPRPPGMFRPDPDPDARAPGNLSDVEAAIFEVQTRAEQVGAILGERDPHRHGQIAGTATQLVDRPRPTPRLRRIASSPSSGASARISTAAGDPFASVTTFTRQWMP